MGDRCVPSLIVINSIMNQLASKVSLITTRCLRLFVVVYKTSILFKLYGHMYCYYNVLPEAIFVVYIKKNFGGPTCNEYLSSCKISSSVVFMLLAVQFFNKIKRKEKKKKKKTKNKKDMFRCISRMLCRNTFIFREYILFWYILDIDVTKNGNNSKPKVKSEFSLILSMGLMLIKQQQSLYTHVRIINVCTRVYTCVAGRRTT